MRGSTVDQTLNGEQIYKWKFGNSLLLAIASSSSPPSTLTGTLDSDSTIGTLPTPPTLPPPPTLPTPPTLLGLAEEGNPSEGGREGTEVWFELLEGQDKLSQ